MSGAAAMALVVKMMASKLNFAGAFMAPPYNGSRSRAGVIVPPMLIVVLLLLLLAATAAAFAAQFGALITLLFVVAVLVLAYRRLPLLVFSIVFTALLAAYSFWGDPAGLWKGLLTGMSRKRYC